MGDEEYPPLLHEGFHEMTLDELKTLTVDGFPDSDRRPMLWQNFLNLLAKINAEQIPCDIWIDGSFLTQKIDPDDIDFVADIPIEVMESGTASQSALVEQLSAREFKKVEKLHSFVMFIAPEGHAVCDSMATARSQWAKDFGLSYIKKEPKGIAVLKVRP